MNKENDQQQSNSNNDGDEIIEINTADHSSDHTAVIEEEEILFGFWEVFKQISSLSIPMALSFTFSFEIFLITVLTSYLGENEEEVAAATLIATMINTLAVIGMSPLFSMSVIESNKIGELTEAERRGESQEQLAAKREYISGVNRNGLWLAGILTLPVMSGLIFSKPILTTIFRQNEKVSEITQNFLRIYSPAIGGVLTRIANEQTLFSFGRAKAAMVLGLIGLGVGTGTSLWLGFGGAGVPKLGSKGIAIGYVVESYLTSILYGLYLACHKDFKEFSFFRIFKKFDGQAKQMLELLKIGSSISVSVASEMAMSLSLGVLSGLQGTRQQSAITYINEYNFFNFLLLASFGQSNAQELNRLIGASKYKNAQRVGVYGLVTTVMYTAPIPIFFAIAPNLLVIFSKEGAQVKDILKWLAPIISSGIVLDSVRYNLLQQLRVLNDLKGSTIISVSSLGLGIGASTLLSLKTKLGIYGAGLGYSAGIMIAVPGLLYRWNNRIQHHKIMKANVLQEDNKKAPIEENRVSIGHTRSSFFNSSDRNIEETPLSQPVHSYGSI